MCTWGFVVAVVILKISDDDSSSECEVEFIFSGEVSDKLKDFFSDPEYWNVIRDGLSDSGFFAENILQ